MIPIFVGIAFLSEPKQILEARVGGSANCVGFAKDGKSLIALSANGGYAFSFPLPNGKGTQLNKVAGRNRACSYNQSTKLLLVAHEDAQSTGKMIIDTQHLGSADPVKSLDVTGSKVLPQHAGDRFAVTNQKGTTIYRSETFTPIVTWPIPILALAIDHEQAAAFDGKNISVRAFPSGKVLRTFPFRGDIYPGLAFSEREHIIIAIGMDTLLTALDSRTGNSIWQMKNSGATSALVISPNRKMLAYGTMYGAFSVVRLANGKPVASGSCSEGGSVYPTMGVDWSPDSRYVAAGFNTGEVKAWDLGH